MLIVLQKSSPLGLPGNSEVWLRQGRRKSGVRRGRPDGGPAVPVVPTAQSPLSVGMLSLQKAHVAEGQGKGSPLWRQAGKL